MPRESRRKTEVNVTPYLPLVEEALRAFGSDVSYAVAMSRAAVTIERKREVHRIRRQVRRAEEKARETCKTQNFACLSPNPCGTGTCLFAEGELAKIDVVAEGSKECPPNSLREPYSIDKVIEELQSRRPKSLARPRTETDE